MRPAGFSTGAVALGDFRRGLTLMAQAGADAVELSALRYAELEPLVAALPHLNLTQYRHVSLHAPSAFAREAESHVLELLKKVTSCHVHVVVHPDALYDVSAWTTLGRWLCIENMDKRKSTGRSAKELADIFEALPEAGLCFDIAHARQVDGSMVEAYQILKAFRSRVRQVHVSEVAADSSHARVSRGAADDFREVAGLIPTDAAIIVESQVQPSEVAAELEAARAALRAIPAAG